MYDGSLKQKIMSSFFSSGKQIKDVGKGLKTTPLFHSSTKKGKFFG